MDIWRRVLLCLGGLYGALGVAAAAWAAHMTDSPLLETASQFLILHAAALVGLGGVLAAIEGGRVPLLVGTSAIALGTFLFCGDLALRAFTEQEYKWGTAPVGGSVLIVGWLFVAIGGAFSRLR